MLSLRRNSKNQDAYGFDILNYNSANLFALDGILGQPLKWLSGHFYEEVQAEKKVTFAIVLTTHRPLWADFGVEIENWVERD